VLEARRDEGGDRQQQAKDLLRHRLAGIGEPDAQASALVIASDAP